MLADWKTISGHDQFVSTFLCRLSWDHYCIYVYKYIYITDLDVQQLMEGGHLS